MQHSFSILIKCILLLIMKGHLRHKLLMWMWDKKTLLRKFLKLLTTNRYTRHLIFLHRNWLISEVFEVCLWYSIIGRYIVKWCLCTTGLWVVLMDWNECMRHLRLSEIGGVLWKAIKVSTLAYLLLRVRNVKLRCCVLVKRIHSLTIRILAFIRLSIKT